MSKQKLYSCPSRGKSQVRQRNQIAAFSSAREFIQSPRLVPPVPVPKIRSDILDHIAALRTATIGQWRLNLSSAEHRKWIAQCDQLRRLMFEAQAAFAESNRWRGQRSMNWRWKKRGFNPQDIGQVLRRPCPEIFSNEILDHCDFFWDADDGRCVAIASHVYGYTKNAVAKANALAAQYDLVCRESSSSWYFPGRCKLLVFCEPDHQVRFLSERRGEITK